MNIPVRARRYGEAFRAAVATTFVGVLLAASEPANAQTTEKCPASLEMATLKWNFRLSPFLFISDSELKKILGIEGIDDVIDDASVKRGAFLKRMAQEGKLDELLRGARLVARELDENFREAANSCGYPNAAPDNAFVDALAAKRFQNGKLNITKCEAGLIKAQMSAAVMAELVKVGECYARSR